MELILVGIPAIVIVLLIMHRFGAVLSLSSLLLVACGLIPVVLVRTSSVPHVGIAAGGPEASSYGIVLGLTALFLLTGRGRAVRWRRWVPYVAWLVFASVFFWAMNAEQVAGLVQLAAAPVAWALGCQLSSDLRKQPQRAGRFVVVVVGVVAVQLVVVVLQLVGLPINEMAPAQQALLAGRFNGTLGHPNDLGKVIFFLLVILLVLSQRGGVSRRSTSVALGAGLLVLSLTGGRAVTIGAVIALLVWVLLAPRDSGAPFKKLTAIGAVVGVILFVAGTVVSRFDEDPVGGDRSPLTALAVHQLGLAPFQGVGPNSYVTVVGQYDRLTATGVPVHNAYLLTAVEIGIVGAFLLFLPLLAGVPVALRSLLTRRGLTDGERGLLAVLPGFILISTTGWGLIGGYVLPLAAFTFGFLRSAPTVAPFYAPRRHRVDRPRRDSTASQRSALLRRQR